MRFGTIVRVCALSVGFLFLSAPAVAQPTINSVVNGASFQPLVSPGSLVSVFGVNLAPSTEAAPAVPLPTMINGVSVEVEGVAAPLYFVSDEQINAQIPFETSGDRVSFVVVTPQGRSPEFVVGLQSTAPGIFTASADGRGAPLLFDAGFNLTDTVQSDQRFILYATGLGAAEPVGETGAGGAGSEPLNRVIETPEVYIGQQRATVEFAGLAPGFVGVYQVNIVGPPEIISNRLFLVAGGRSTNVTTIDVDAPAPIQGSGVLTRQTREIGDFQRIQILGVAGVNVTVGQAGGTYEIEAETNLIELIRAEAVDGVMRVTVDRPISTSEGPTITLKTLSLDRVELRGVGSVVATGVSGEMFEVRLSGVGSVEASGSVDAVDVVLQGAGNALLSDLQARRGNVQLTGVGNVSVQVTQELFARVSGPGNLTYTGSPAELDAVATGVGTIQGN